MFDMRQMYVPETVAEALRLLADNPEARIMAGGSDNLVQLRDGKLGGLDWISIQGLDDLRQITLADDGTLRIGALCTFTQISENDLVRRCVPSLPQAVGSIGGPQVRNIGTIGGNISNGVPSADSASTCFAWDAKLELARVDGVRVIPISEYYISAGKVDRQPGELLTAVIFAKEAYQGYKGAFIKYAMRNAMDIATVNCSTNVKLAEDGTIADARIAYGVAAPTPIRAPHGEDALKGQTPSKDAIYAAAKAAIEDTRARDSWRASKAFRLHLLEELTRRCLLTSIKRAGGEIGAQK